MSGDPAARPGHAGRRLLIVACVLVLAVVTATSATRLLPSATHVAVGGPLAMHRDRSGASLANELPDAPPPPEVPGPVTLAVPGGPHLTVPILYYHYVRVIVPSPRNLLSYDLSISPSLFAKQMALLRAEGAHPITLAMLMDALAGRGALPSHPVILTFDDGYADFASGVQPVLARYGFVATDYVVSGFLNRPRYMTAAQVRQMDAAGMVIGSHTVHHVDLAAIPTTAARTEIDNGKAALERLLGHPVVDFAYPYGAFNAAVVALVQQAGFRDAVSTMGGSVQSLSGRFLLRRTEIGGAPSLGTFARDAGLPPPGAVQAAQIDRLALSAPSAHY
ncbi:MAG: polysaccharide deacetylase family protein [Candidatus Dormibacteria bacterium]